MVIETYLWFGICTKNSREKIYYFWDYIHTLISLWKLVFVTYLLACSILNFQGYCQSNIKQLFCVPSQGSLKYFKGKLSSFYECHWKCFVKWIQIDLKNLFQIGSIQFGYVRVWFLNQFKKVNYLIGNKKD